MKNPSDSLNLISYTLSFCVIFLMGTLTTADVTLPKIFHDNMVLQQGMPVPIWGKSDPAQVIKVSFASQVKETKADAGGKWILKLNPLKANSTPSKMVISGKKSITFKNILVGEVWLCSGQSNMSMGIVASKNAKEAIATANNSLIRLFYINHQFDLRRKGYPDTRKEIASLKHSKWKVCSSKTIQEDGEHHKGWKKWKGFTAVGYYFGRELQKELKVPVGLIQSSIGGSSINGWIKAEKSPMLKSLYPFAIRGVIWYQGEANYRDGMLYVEPVPK